MKKTYLLSNLLTDLEKIKLLAAEKESENDAFRLFLQKHNSTEVDTRVHQLNKEISNTIDCTKCGNCCRSLMINVTESETISLSAHLQISIPELEEKYIEKSQQGQMIMKSIPCAFLSNSACTIYLHRFNECREFPHLHRPNFTNRLFGTLIYYSLCPIIFNVVERLKIEVGFKSL